jgi:DNA helicase-2/ATP-dependent DNA helicase PcrA
MLIKNLYSAFSVFLNAMKMLTVRIAYLMSLGVDAFNILALTFTNKAAREMKKRIADIVGSNEAKNLWMGTFHSVFAKNFTKRSR